jgi:hypothetical protein
LGLRRSAAAISTAAADPRLGWAPIFAALAIDLADFAMTGPIGLAAGLFVGGVLTMVVALLCGVRPRRAIGLGVLGGIYCALPVTDLVPLATMLTALYGLLLRRKAATPVVAEPAVDGLEPAAGRVVQAGPGLRDGAAS